MFFKRLPLTLTFPQCIFNRKKKWIAKGHEFDFLEY